jgi:hypothetical protein
MARWKQGVLGKDIEAHRTLFECFLSEQMSLAQLQEHMQQDPDFCAYVLERTRPKDTTSFD